MLKSWPVLDFLAPGCILSDGTFDLKRLDEILLSSTSERCRWSETRRQRRRGGRVTLLLMTLLLRRTIRRQVLRTSLLQAVLLVCRYHHFSLLKDTCSIQQQLHQHRWRLSGQPPLTSITKHCESNSVAMQCRKSSVPLFARRQILNCCRHHQYQRKPNMIAITKMRTAMRTAAAPWILSKPTPSKKRSTTPASSSFIAAKAATEWSPQSRIAVLQHHNDQPGIDHCLVKQIARATNHLVGKQQSVTPS